MEALRAMVDQNPDDSFARYGLALEHAKAGDLPSAVAELRALVERDPDYVPAYYQGGQALERLGKTEEARDFYRKGVAAATRTGDRHALGELQAALDLL